MSLSTRPARRPILVLSIWPLSCPTRWRRLGDSRHRRAAAHHRPGADSSALTALDGSPARCHSRHCAANASSACWPRPVARRRGGEHPNAIVSRDQPGVARTRCCVVASATYAVANADEGEAGTSQSLRKRSIPIWRGCCRRRIPLMASVQSVVAVLDGLEVTDHRQPGIAPDHASRRGQ